VEIAKPVEDTIIVRSVVVFGFGSSD
jgi:hypothetical protein